MALEHVLLVALRERGGSGLELTRRFERTIGFFWQASHQQIYRTLGRMADDGWVEVETVAQAGRPDKKVYAVSPLGAKVLAEWLATPSPPERLRTEIAVKMRGASYGDRGALLAELTTRLADHRARLQAYRAMEREQFPDPAALGEAARDRWLVLRGGVLMEQFWIAWLGDYLAAHGALPPRADPRTDPRTDPQTDEPTEEPS
ncbi:PadR family transcriptional regulator [Nocardioides zeae]|uniref:PadR family transcriptional regulator n=1 Tax=Nocardioides imazamoxiresistens TaxID=3231893 RepID=A0ABU3PV32_9ACTN|nr:PadR family transcriptional regulator [Nocardioides zeae]MDT9593059.1 PadR family transcriptional regulator [Nocardioides zeae]